MAKATKTPAPKPTKQAKPRANKYDEKLIIDGTFEELTKHLITPAKAPKKK